MADDGRHKPSVLSVLSERIGDAPRVSLREAASTAAGAPVIDPASAERASLPEGRGNYQILGEIARGGMGVVLRKETRECRISASRRATNRTHRAPPRWQERARRLRL